jgi:2-haloacid dehalogenase
MVRAITFDAFGTIIDEGRDSLDLISRAVCDDHRPELDAEALLATWDKHFLGQEGEVFATVAEITEDSLGKAFLEHGIDADPKPYVDRLVDLWREAKVYAEVPAVLAAMDGIPRAVVSNADHEFLVEILRRNRLRFDAVITSESARTYKPRPRIFEAALESLRVDPEEVVHVGDSLHADVGGASRLGMRTIWVNRTSARRGPADPVPDAEAKDLAALPKIIAGIAGSTSRSHTVK